MKGSEQAGERFRFERGVASELNYYGIGFTPMFACQADPRFSYCLYVPEAYIDRQDEAWPLAVIVHGTDRPAQRYCEAFIEFADANDCIILAPLFPGGITRPWELNSYKWMKSGGIRFDQILLAMIDEISAVYNLASDRFLMHGFSGGGHFSHRMFYLHPDRILGVSIGAPGVVTLLDFEHDWWVGVRDLEEQFGTPIDLEAMRRVPVHMIVGGDDTAEWEISIKPGDTLWMDGADIANGNRQFRMEKLKQSYERNGIQVRHTVVPGIAHEGFKLLGPVKQFFADVLDER